VDQVTFDLIIERFKQLCSKKFSWIKTVRKDPEREWGLVYETDFGQFKGSVKKEGEDFVFQIGEQEIILWEKTFLGKSH
jgi:hypothetical protein